MSGAFTVYCQSCERPLLVQRRGVTYTVEGIRVLSSDERGVREALCICSALWKRDSQITANLLS